MSNTTPIRKVIYSSDGGPEVVSVIDGDLPPAPRDHVQIRILTAGFSGANINMRNGTYPLQKPNPMTPGYSLIGRVVSNGERSTKFKPGDLVACLSVYDAHATYANMPEKFCISVPEGLDLQQAVALVLDYTTAYGLVFRTGNVQKGQRVFIHGASGAVGYAAVLLCKTRGAEIYGTAGETNHAALREAGVTPFSYKNKNWIQAMKELGGAHVVFDALGFESWDESWDILSRTEPSILVGYGGNGRALNGEKAATNWGAVVKLVARNLSPFGKRSTALFLVARTQSTFEPELTKLFGMLKSGELRVPIRQSWTLEEVPEAHRQWGKLSGSVGSLVIDVAKE